MNAKTLTLEEAAAILDEIAGRARCRTLGMYALLSACKEARRTGTAGRFGGYVANAYGYRADTMRLGVRRLRSRFAFRADWGNAKKGSSSVPGGGRVSQWEKWIRHATVEELAKAGYSFVSARDIDQA